MRKHWWWGWLGPLALASAALTVAVVAHDVAPVKGEIPPAQGGTVITDTTTVGTDTTWSPDGNPYILKASLTVAPSVTLTITAGTMIALDECPPCGVLQPANMSVKGKLVVAGTPGQRVSITSREIITNNRGTIWFDDFNREWLSEGSTFQYADLKDMQVGLIPRYARGAPGPVPGPPYVFFDHVSFDRATLWFKAGTISVTNSRVARGESHTLGISSTLENNLLWLNRSLYGSGLTLLTNTIAFNDTGILAGWPITLTSNNLYGNQRYDLCVGGPANATRNWWGTTDLEVIRSHIPCQGKVDILPIATAPIGEAPPLYSTHFPWVATGYRGGW